jgi:3'-5' exoribonuclease
MVKPQVLVDKQFSFLHDIIATIEDPELKEGTASVVNDPQFINCPASKEKHHAYPGGLVVHTAEVMRTALSMSFSPHLTVDNDVLKVAVVWHDYGKVYEYNCTKVTTVPDGKSEMYLIGYTPHRDLVRHLCRSYAMFITRFGDKLDEERLNKIGHCILSHHGRREWGSPVEPQTTEAYILHYADMMSAFCAQKEYSL